MPSPSVVAVLVGLVVATATLTLHYFFTREEEEGYRNTECRNSTNAYRSYDNSPYSYPDNYPRRRRTASGQGGPEVCTICLETIIDRKQIVLQPCKHIFHEACIRELKIQTREQVCPNCRCRFK
ncbi:E3 ubiquitin-protein ligase ARK2C [Nomia melanderi]|uniref:E3 ubiquitin-protein ligase ARK2C n=1 Tax=Nomia melanderi TaxID=2448451 RepID=UPI003FCC760A